MPQADSRSARPRVLLVYPTSIKPDAFFGYLLPPLGLERLAAVIEPFAEVKLLDLRFEGEAWLEKARTFDPDFIGVNVKTTMYASHSYFVADRLRAVIPRARVILGGLHASSVPEEALEHGNAVVIGEGEDAFVELVQGKPWAEIAGLCHRGTDGKPTRTAPRPLRTNLDELPPPARHLRPSNYRYTAAGLISMDLLETSRGCTQFCPFCSPAITHRGKWRAFSPEYVFADVKRIWDRGARFVMLTDDHFSGDLDRAKKISELITAAGIKIAFFCFLRPFLGRMDVKKAMVDAGFVMMSYGAESPNPEQLKRYGKGFSDPTDFIKQVNREWHEAGARYIGNSFVFGDPFEKAEDLARLGDYARDLDATYIEPLYSQPFPGTRYREELEKKGLLQPNRGWDQFTEGRLLVKHPTLDETSLRRQRVRMWLRFFSPRKLVGAFRVPLYFRNVVGLPLRTILKYMKACDYSIFGCILEDKFYFSARQWMVREYLTREVDSFSAHERDMTAFTGEFLEMLGLGPVLRWMGNQLVVFEIFDKKRIVTRFTAKIGNGALEAMRAGISSLEEVQSLFPESASASAVRRIPMRLDDVVAFMTGKDGTKLAAILRGLLYLLYQKLA